MQYIFYRKYNYKSQRQKKTHTSILLLLWDTHIKLLFDGGKTIVTYIMKKRRRKNTRNEHKTYMIRVWFVSFFFVCGFCRFHFQISVFEISLGAVRYLFCLTLHRNFHLSSVQFYKWSTFQRARVKRRRRRNWCDNNNILT